jgi:hypothetical protein
MARRKIDLKIKVQAMRECLHLENVAAIAHKYRVSERIAYHWFAQVLEHLPESLQEAKPGRKGQPHDPVAPPRRRPRWAKP